MHCKKCGTDNHDESCEKCGTRGNADMPETSPGLCERCGFLNDDDSEFCERCGMPLHPSVEDHGTFEPPITYPK